ncbi:RHS repeat domain-containing protein [Chryseobacterium sp. KMC2]|jgi:YD repeat-containing protein|uniref:RHS repeat domain-containing protein n=1 Tax=Chryseobacterium sp. KMC2 TaxID=2800705 RepID=UPI0019243880|nr:RHS repeat domain-containing protein [Chryseobacterium sp. KMC2]MBL3548685.1 RHS repeat protein [Chryseobacterium sp. KMC2]
MKKVIGAIAIIATQIYFAQNTDLLPNIIPPTPQTFNFSVYNSNFTNTPSGEFTHSVPIHTATRDEVSLPIAFSYRSGVRVDDLGTNLGMSWQLNAGGTVSRIVRDEADEKAAKRWLPENVDLINDAAKIQESSLPGPYVDTEYDWFNFNVANGFHGSFYLDSNLNPVYSKADGTTISMNKYFTAEGLFLEFIIKDKAGNTYYFGGQKKYIEEVTITTSNDVSGGGGVPRTKSATGWYIYKIITNKNNEVLFDYDADSYSYFSSVDSSLTLTEDCKCIPSGGNYSTSVVNSKSLSVTSTPRLKLIETDGEKINFEYTKNRNDVTDSKLLTSVIVKNKGNAITKNFVLEYTDYTTSNVESYYFTNANANTKSRHFLNKVSNTVSKEKYSFDYYSPELLPPRFSLKADYYGYYNGQSNTRPFPVINEFNTKDIILFSSLIKNKIPSNYLTANKEVNPNYSFIGNLKKITYPTGGSSSIVYEPNKTAETLQEEKYQYESFDLARECNQPRTIESAKTIIANGSPITFFASASPDYYRCGEPDSYHEIYGVSVKDLTTGQMVKSISRKASDGMFTTTEPGEFCISGINGDCPISTVEGRSYELRFRVQSVLSEIFGNVNFKYNKTLAPVQKDVFYAGSRVKEIIENNNEGSVYTRKFYYNFYAQKDQGKTTLNHPIPPRYYYKTTGLKNCSYDCGCEALPIGPEKSICLENIQNPLPFENAVFGYGTNSLINQFNNKNNKPYYTVISEVVEGKSLTEKIFFENEDTPALTFSGSEIYNAPYSNTSELLQGNIKEEKVYEFKNNEFQKIINQTYQYGQYDNNIKKAFIFKQNFPIPPYTSTPNTYIDNISIAEYYNHYGESKIDRIKKEEFINGQIIKTETENSYNNPSHYQLTLSKNLFPDNTVQETVYNYAHEKGNQKLINANIIGIPLLTSVTKKQNANDSNGKILSKIETKYDDPTTLLPTSVISYGINTGAQSTEITYDKYDSKGNLLQYTTKDGVPTVIIWGYNSTKPIAKIEGVTYAQILPYINAIVSASDQDTAPGTALNNDKTALLDAFKAFRAQFPNSPVTTYTYDPLVGVRSITPPTGITEFYTYDAAGRLEKVVDANGKVIKEMKYNYKN